MEKDNQAIFYKEGKIRNYPLQFKLTAISFAEVHGNRAGLRMTETEYVNGERKKKVLKKLLRIRKLKEPKESVVKELEENLSAKNWMNLFLGGFMKDVGKVFGCQENSLWKRRDHDDMAK